MKSIWLAGAILLFVKNVVIFQQKNYLRKMQKRLLHEHEEGSEACTTGHIKLMKVRT